MDTNQINDRRLSRLEAIHEPDGSCEKHRCEFWKELTRLRDRVTRLEMKLLIGGSIIGVLGPLAAQWLFQWLSRK